MLTDAQLRSKVDALWDKLWSGGLANPLDAIEQISYLLFLKRLDEQETSREQAARRRGQPYDGLFPATDAGKALRWSEWTQKNAADILPHVKEKVFPFLKELGGAGGTFAASMENAEFKINKPALLLEACALIDNLQVSQQNQDVQGDLYEYLLSKLNTAGRNGQFRTPRHIIRLMVKMADPQPGERICDPAAGTCGFPVNAYQHVLETHTSPDILEYDAEGVPHNLVGDRLTPEQHEHLQAEALTAFDNDSGMVMLRIGAMNLMLHGLRQPRFRYTDTLSKGYTEARAYDLILANPPFKGAIDSGDVSDTLPGRVKKTELLFLHLFLRLLDMGGRCAVIVPDGVLFGSSNAHVEIRRELIEKNRLDGVVSMPSGVFKPYAGVSTAILLFTRGGNTGERIWFYDMEHDGFTLDDKRLPTSENDLPDILRCWRHRADPDFAAGRTARLADLHARIEPLKARRLSLQAEVHRLTFEHAVAPEAEAAAALTRLEADKGQMAVLNEEIHPLQREINRLTRQFWVPTGEVRAKKYDLSASRYRQVEQDTPYYDTPQVTLDRLLTLEQVMSGRVKQLSDLIK